MNLFNKIRLKLYKNPRKIANIYRKMGMIVGTNCKIFSTASMGSEPYLIKLGNNVKIVDRVTFVTHDGGIEVIRNMYDLPNLDFFGTIEVGNNVFFGIGSTILLNVKIGDNVIIGAGSIVTKDIPSNSIVAGIPAKVINTIDNYYNKVKIQVDYTKEMSPREKYDFLREKYKFNDKSNINSKGE